MEQEAPEQEIRILITGAKGFVGRHLIAQLLETEDVRDAGIMLDENPSATASGDRQNSIDRYMAGSMYAKNNRLRIFAGARAADFYQSSEKPVSFDKEGWTGGVVQGFVEVVQVELEDSDSLAKLIARIQPHHIYHLAARSSGADIDREAVYAANVSGTRNLLEAAAHLVPFPRVLLASTGYVYGNTDPLRPAREEDPIGPLWKYGAYTDSKIEMETIARSYRAFAVCARAFAHTGPGQAPTFAVPGFARQIVRMERGQETCELRVGNLDALRDILDVRDVVRAYSALMMSVNWQNIAGEALNVSTGQPVRMRQVVEHLIALSQINPEIIVDPARLRPLDIATSTGDATRLAFLTHWKPKISLDTTLQDLLAYWRTQVKA